MRKLADIFGPTASIASSATSSRSRTRSPAILTHPLGASLGDLLAQSREYGGLGLGTTYTSLVFLAVIATLVVVVSVGSSGSRLQQEAIEEA